MLNWYRALLREMLDSDSMHQRVAAPTRILWGQRDAFLRKEMARESLEFCDRGELFEFPDATHWV